MDKQTLIITDADAIIALANSLDDNHEQARAISVKLTSINASVVTPMTAITEAITTMQRKMKRPDLAKTIAEKVKDGAIQIINSEVDDFKSAMQYYNPDGSMKNTFYDAIIAGTAKRYHAAAIFSFDGWYEKLGFQLAESFLVK